MHLPWNQGARPFRGNSGFEFRPRVPIRHLSTRFFTLGQQHSTGTRQECGDLRLDAIGLHFPSQILSREVSLALARYFPCSVT